MRRRLLSVLFALVLLSCAISTAFAYEVPDLPNGSITFQILPGEDNINSGILRVYRVGDIIVDDANYSFRLLPGLPEIENSINDTDNPELAEELKKLARENKKDLLYYEAEIEDNIVYFPDVKAGLYVVVQTKAIKGYDFMAPFLISVPRSEDGELDYTVYASPKVPIETRPTQPTESTTKPTDPKLPQTGQLNWPVPVMVTVGIVLVFAGWLLLRSDKKEKYES